MQIHRLIFNPYEVNTYIISDATGQSIIIDPACCSPEERTVLQSYIEQHRLNPVWLINTHGHFDHVIGNAFVCGTWQVKTAAHRSDLFLMEKAYRQGETFGFPVEPPPVPEVFFEDGDELTVNDVKMTFRHIPGHSPGSIVIALPEEKKVFAGDVLFNGSIGRSDLPGGDYDLLMDGITRKLLTLPPDTAVFPGHGPATSIGEEMLHNPFLTNIQAPNP